MDINDHRRNRKAAADKMRAQADLIAELEGAEEVDADAVAAAQAEFDAAKAAFETADKAVKRCEEAEAAQAASAAAEIDTLPTPQAPVPAAPRAAGQEAIEVGFMVHALANTGGDAERAAERLEANGHSAISAALSSATEAAGGVTVPRPMADAIIGLLRPRVTVLASGAVVHDMPAGEMRNARVTGAPTASYEAENASIPESEPTFDKVDEKFKKLTCLVPISNSLLRHANPSSSVALLIRNLIIQEMALKQDIAFLRYDGSGNLPKGLINWALAGQTQTGVAATAAATEAAVRRAVSDVEDADVAMLSPGWIMRASAKNWLASLKDATSGYPVFPSIERSGELMGYPIKTTSQLPNNLGVGTNETEVVFADFAEVMVGDTQDIILAQSTEASYVTGGTTYSAFQQDKTLMRAISEHDIAPMHDEAISVINGVAWSL